MPSEAHLSWRVRLAFAVGQLPEGIKSAAFGFLLLFYYNQVLGLSGTLSGTAVFIAVLFDALSDPLVGSLSDTTRSRWGRRHPYMYAAALPFAASFYYLFAPPEGLSETGLFIWLTGFAVLTRTFLTFYSVPHMSLGAELSQDYDERTLLSSLRMGLQLVGMFAVLIGGPQLYFHATAAYPNGQLNPAAYPEFATAAFFIMVLGIWLSALGTHDQIRHLPAAAQTVRFSLLRVLGEMRDAFRMGSFIAVVSSSIAAGMNQGMVQALILYTGTYFFELSPGQITILFGVSAAGVGAGTTLARPLSNIIREKKHLYMIGHAWYAVFTTWVIILRLLEVLPPNEDPIVAVLYLTSSAISGVGLGLAIPMGGSMMADLTDEHERIHGQRQEGIYYAAASFAGKAVGGSGTILAGLVIDLAGIPAGADPATVDPQAVVRFGWALGPSVLLMTAISLGCIYFYRISRATHSEILRELAVRRRERSI
ncbi:MAG: MFS transporter [Kiritimatiellia bacterium]|jgi:Na+/melibiose symporter-like transporter|nr:MFS transporter [Pseudomonadales bacterium]MDP7024068.1 MFS transporter [Kiritimatiellia bacterium]|tara:strand:- start:10 stop:1449 length:1440 start_codon:yes stop_codon:yes gene_type:complete